MGTFRYDRVGFNVEVVKKMTEEQFVSHQMHENHYTTLSKDLKEKLLKSIYKLITGSSPEK